MSENLARIGVAVFLYKPNGDFLLMKRRGSHGAGTWGLPGGHVEFGEDARVAAIREVFEELNQVFVYAELSEIGWSEAFFKEEKKHYVTLLFKAAISESQVPRIMESEKCDELRWVDGHRVELPDPLFLPLSNYITKYGVPRFGSNK